MERLGIVARIVDLVCDFVMAPFEASRVLSRVLTSLKVHEIEDVNSTFVAMTSWSRIPRHSAHSPMKTSEDSS